jgi:ribosomal protein S18 acetylase RimI-like enzyme
MNIISLHDKAQIEAFLRQDVAMNLYALGDLEDRFFRYTIWYAQPDDHGEIKHLALVYLGLHPPILLSFDHDLAGQKAFLANLSQFLPDRLYTLLSVGAVKGLSDHFEARPYGLHYRMMLTQPEMPRKVTAIEAMLLNDEHLPAITNLYYGGHKETWFDPWLLETQQYFGIWCPNQPHQLASIAGVHCFSPEYGVAAIGNVTTHPDYRGRGLAQKTTARLCQSLAGHVQHIGLNVKADNAAALAVYDKLGFQVAGHYEEFMLSRTLHHKA